MAYPHVITSDSIVVTVNGKPTNVQRGAPNFESLRNALVSQNWDEVDKCLNVSSAVENWSKGQFKIDGERIVYKGEKLPEAIASRMLRIASAGEDPAPLMKFWEKLQKNPSWRSVEQLFPFLEHQGIPIQPNGNFLAYKGVNNNYTDCHTGRVDNKPGTVNEMPRNKISDDPKTPCHYGFHVGALSYARDFGSTVVVCEVDPADVVCIPYDESQQKMRVCKYKVIGNHNGEYLPSTTYELEEELGKDTEIEPEVEEEVEVETPGQVQEQTPVAQDLIASAAQAVDAIPENELEQHAAEVKKETILKVPEVKKPKEKMLKEPREKNSRPKLKVPAAFKKMHQMETLDLMQQELGKLRTYASQVLSIVGASKIPGGKTTLVAQIIKVRKNYS